MVLCETGVAFVPAIEMGLGSPFKPGNQWVPPFLAQWIPSFLHFFEGTQIWMPCVFPMAAEHWSESPATVVCVSPFVCFQNLLKHHPHTGFPELSRMAVPKITIWLET